ncbi:hypothetical protein [Brevibacterium spongiae]|uniref:Uncharacterized protein n=1 Tax=Brevibacterium spongiae TaxID=2909672 RepID=A0ABY5SLM9_9MICO|nr:hypothetical protein [Brevibacterium spongiae]UVI35423.1 hypothetical protein L1F31_15060 [Brevibacterium spongiae]
MDTSIIVVIAIVVVFAVAVPAMIRKSATELSRAEIDTVPDNAAVVAAEIPNPGHDHSERTQVFHDKPRKTPSVPTPHVSADKDAPTLSLSAATPAFAVIDGLGQARTVTEAAESSQPTVLPVAVGETHSAFSADHASGHAHAGQAGTGSGLGLAGTGNVRPLHPAVSAVFNDSTPAGGRQNGSARTPQAPTPHASASGRTESTGARSRPADAASPRGGAPRGGGAGTGRGGRLGEGEATTTDTDPQISTPSTGTDEEHAMTEQATTLRESLKSLNTMVKGFAVVFLASVLGILVTGVLALFSVVHIALAGVFLGLAVVSLFLVRTLNLRKAATKKQLRRLERTPKSAAPTRTAPKQTATKPTTPNQSSSKQTVPVKEQQSHASTAPATGRTAATGGTAPTAKQSTPTRTTERTRTAAQPAASAPTSSGTAARIAAAAQARSGSTKAAQARAAMAHGAESKKAREEADTGEIPLVRVRKEDSEGHTTRQVLLTGPIPVVKENAPAEATEQSDRESTKAPAEKAPATAQAEKVPAAKAPAEKSSSEQSSTASAAEESTSRSTSESSAEAPVSLGSDLVADQSTSGSANESSTGAERDADVHAALDAAAQVDDPFMQRLKSRDGWSPTPLPVPSYVDAPEAEHPVPSATAADASSYETEARSREDIAAEFAAELGYRPELSDSAREDGPLGHGRKAIRTTKAADLGAVNDVLARRRA